MSLATRCPYCQTTFRVTHDQLKLRSGLVRCGSCKEIFNGVEHLLSASPAATPGTAAAPPVGAMPIARPATPTATTQRAADASAPTGSGPAGELASPPEGGSQPIAAEGAPTQSASFAIATDAADADLQERASTEEQPYRSEPIAHYQPADAGPETAARDTDPLTRMTLMDIRPAADGHERLHEQAAPHGREADEVSRAIDELQSKPWRQSGADSDVSDEIDALDDEEPEFVRRARRQQRLGKRLRLALMAGSVALAMLAVLQAGIAFRTTIAAHWPATMPALSQLCSAFGCKVGMPAQIEFVTIESHELQAMPASDNTFTLGLLLRNRSSIAQEWPHLQLTLKDQNGQPVVRRVLAPSEYLTPQDRSRGFGPTSEKPVRMTFSLAQLKASGYELQLFYP